MSELKPVFKPRFGDKNSNWKGGRIYDGDGYVIVYKPDHPYANSIGHVREHRLVYEQFLGRYLTPDEVIHHKNGIRDDNRIENLEKLTPNLHASLHFKKDMSDRYCSNCGRTWTYVNKRGYTNWAKCPNDPNKFWCANCYGCHRKKEKRNARRR